MALSRLRLRFSLHPPFPPPHQQGRGVQMSPGLPSCGEQQLASEAQPSLEGGHSVSRIALH